MKIFLCVLIFYPLIVLKGHQFDHSYPEGYEENCSIKLDSQTEQLLLMINESPPSFRKIPIEELQRLSREERPEMILSPTIERIETISVEGPNGPLRLRIYKPKASIPIPVFIFFHGGGWIAGSIDQYDYFCQEICTQSNCLIVSVGYGQAPDHPFPQPLDDCYFAANWVEEHIGEKGGDSKRIAIGGDSAGGNLAAAVTLKARENQKTHFVCQLLICPALNYNFDTLSYFEFSEGYLITRKDMKFFWNNYTVHYKKQQNPFISPLTADSLAQLPPAFLLIANFDPLRDEALAYGLRLHRDGVLTRIKRFNSIHGFYIFKDLDVSKEAIAFIASVLSEQLLEASQKSN